MLLRCAAVCSAYVPAVRENSVSAPVLSDLTRMRPTPSIADMPGQWDEPICILSVFTHITVCRHNHCLCRRLHIEQQIMHRHTASIS